MASLLVTDELSDAYAEMEAIRNDAGVAARLDAEEELAEGIESLADRIENIAVRLEQS